MRNLELSSVSLLLDQDLQQLRITMLNWAFFPRSLKPTSLALDVVKAFADSHEAIDSYSHERKSNDVLASVGPKLAEIGFRVELGKRKDQRIHVPVLYGNNGFVQKAFEADAHHTEMKFVIEVEAGRAVMNNQFLKDLFQACMMDEVEYLAIAVRNIYAYQGGESRDFDQVVMFFDTLYASDRMRLPLKGILVIGY